MATFILVPGGWQGAWAFESVAELLRSRGHDAMPLTLAGLGDAGATVDGLTCAPPPNLDPRCRPHPIGTFLQAIELSGRWRKVPRKIFIGAHGWDGSPFLELYNRLSADNEWATFSFNCGHNIPRLQPEAFVEIALAQI